METTPTRESRSADTSVVARVVATLALLIAVAVVVAVVAGSIGDDGGGGGGGDRGSGQADQRVEGPPKRRFYVVEPGDSLSSIAAEFGLTVDELQRLNKDIDPQALATGQELKLK